MLLIGLLFLGVAVAEGNPQNHENIGSKTLSTYMLKGKVKQFKECIEGWGCETTSFNSYGIEEKYLKSRKFIKSDKGVLIFEALSGPEYSPRLKEYFQNNRLIRTEGIDVADPKQIHVTEYLYSGNLLKSVNYKIIFKEEMRVWRSEIMNHTNGILTTIETFSENGSKEKIIIEKGILPTKKFDLRYPNPIEAYTYKLDSNGNWIELKVNGNLERTREIIYY